MNLQDREFRRRYERFYSTYAGVDDLLEVAESICTHRASIHGAAFSLDISLDRVLAHLRSGRPRKRGFRVSRRSPYLISVPIVQRDSALHGSRAKAFLLADSDDGLLCLLGLKDDFEYLWADFQKYLRSDITPVYLSTEDFRRAFQTLAQRVPSQAPRISGFTANVLCDDDQRVKTRREWFRTPKQQADFFGELAQERQWLRSVELVLDSPAHARGRVRRDLHFSCQDGFRSFYETVLVALHQVGSGSTHILENRAVVSSPTRASRPIQISYESQVFADKRQNHRLIAVLREMPDSALSVFHPNPFLHASLVDYADGSSYTIWVTDNAAVKVIPELKATAASLGRLCNHINEYFSEGTIEEIGT